MIKNLIFDLSNTLLFSKNPGSLSLNKQHDQFKLDEKFIFFDKFFIYQETFEKLNRLTKTKKLFICTSGDIQQDPAITPYLAIFDHIYSSQTIGLNKNNPLLYKRILTDNNLLPSETLFIDDLSRNLKAASIAGLKTHRYTSEGELHLLLNKLIKEDRE